METDRREKRKGFSISAAEVFKARLKHKDRFATTATDIPGVSARHEPAVEVSLARKTAARLLGLAEGLRRVKAATEAAKKQKGDDEKELKGILKEHEGLTGIQSEAHNLKLNAVPTVEYDLDLLRVSLGARFPTFVDESIVVTIDPGATANARGRWTESRVRGLFTAAFGHRGVSEDRVREGIQIKTEYTVHRDELEKAVARDEVTLVEGAVTIGRDYTIGVVPLHGNQPSEPEI